ncbi:MAG: sigma-54 dependent transcriptional regulator [Tannerella sp.]|jgi:two-component system NtrC family response regulator|nr:sigma-54 dependent transcriptional regulator [Tannerella sp.]
MILIIDDDAAIRSSLEFVLKRAGYDTQAVATPDAALTAVRRMPPDLVLMDMNFSLSTSGEEGLRLLRQVKTLCSEVPVILITAWGSISLAVEGMRAGAFDFITKPWDNMMLLNSIRTALALNSPAGSSTDEPHFDKIIGKSKALRQVLQTVSRIAATDASVLITGENGTGKELIAEAIHSNSARRDAPFVKVNLGGISQGLFESEMFGHCKGAFTDAISDRTGRFTLADKGTIFLDEIGDLDMSCQVKLLRVLQDRTFEVLGDSHPHRVDVRVVSATNADLAKKIAERQFREDLYYRINLITIHIPPLRERREDIPLLVRHFADELARQQHLPKTHITDDAIEYLCRQPFPGNVRELKNLTERTLLISGKTTLDVADFSEHISDTSNNVLSPTGLNLEEMEKRSIEAAIEKSGGNMAHAARSLGISRPALYRRMAKYGII